MATKERIEKYDRHLYNERCSNLRVSREPAGSVRCSGALALVTKRSRGPAYTLNVSRTPTRRVRSRSRGRARSSSRAPSRASWRGARPPPSRCCTRTARRDAFVRISYSRAGVGGVLERGGRTWFCESFMSPLTLVMLTTEEVQPGTSSLPLARRPRKAVVLKKTEKALIW